MWVHMYTYGTNYTERRGWCTTYSNTALAHIPLKLLPSSTITPQTQRPSSSIPSNALLGVSLTSSLTACSPDPALDGYIPERVYDGLLRYHAACAGTGLGSIVTRSVQRRGGLPSARQAGQSRGMRDEGRVCEGRHRDVF